MKNMRDKTAVSDLQARLSRIEPNTLAKWGKFDAPGMLCHLIDQMNFVVSPPEDVTLENGPPMIVRHLVRLYLPWPKGAPTVDAMLTTKPDSWDADSATVSELMGQFAELPDSHSWPNHPFFGTLDGKGWGALTWRHTNHHFKQFGV